MICEVCGQKIIGKHRKVNIEGANLIVCRNCAKFGDTPTILHAQARKLEPSIPRTQKMGGAKKSRIKSGKKKDFLLTSYELIDDYMDKIRKAREERRLSQEELAKKINERVSIIKKIEIGKMRPPQTLAKKLEKELQINLHETVDSAGLAIGSKDYSKELTLGDIVNIKKKK
ncbi:MAG: multiprotein bridging factor aMBF1 [Candidatus Freyarchaeota archaeon]